MLKASDSKWKGECKQCEPRVRANSQLSCHKSPFTIYSRYSLLCWISCRSMDASLSEDTPRKTANSSERSSKSHHGLSENYTNNCTHTRVKSTADYCKKRHIVRLYWRGTHSWNFRWPHLSNHGKHKDHPLTKRIRHCRWLDHAEAIGQKAGLNSLTAEGITTQSATTP